MNSSESNRQSDATGSVPRAFKLAVLVPLARLRFLIILGAIGLVIASWDALLARYQKLMRPPAAATADANVEYFCPMHPTIVRDNNKDKCPICFMPLSKRAKGEESEVVLPPGTVSRVQLSPYRVVLAGVRTTTVGYHELHRDITTVGTIEFNERGLRNVSARFKGRIEKLFVNETGQAVKKGDPLASLYSPDLVVTVQNLLDAKRNNNDDGAKIARDRLILWGIEPDQIDDIIKSGKPITQLTIRSPIDGHVVRRYPREGQYVDEGGPLYDVADLSTVWVQAQLYEDDLAVLPRGAHDPKTGLPTRPIAVEATTRARPGETFRGSLSFVFPHIDPETRTLTIRFELANPEHELRPGMSTTVRLNVAASELPSLPFGRRLRSENGKVLAIPEASVIDTGRQKVVYRESLPNTFNGALVELGPRLTDANDVPYFPVLKGLEPGEVIVTTGSFLIDAETRLNPAATSIYIGGGRSGAQVRPSTPADEDAKIEAALSGLNAKDRALAEAQRICPVTDERLGSMGVPIKVVVKNIPVFVCCKGCDKAALAMPDETLRKVAEFKAKTGGNKR